jgi:YVTN family beta-propeller protein
MKLTLIIGALLASVSVAISQETSTARLLVLLRDSSTLAIVDPVAGIVLGRVQTVTNPHEITASDDGRLAFVASPTAGISVIDLEALIEIRRIDIGAGSEPHDVRYAAGKLYFTAEGYKTIGRYDPASNKVEWLLGIGKDGTHMLVMSEDLNTIFTADRGSNTVTIIDGIAAGPTNSTVTSIAVGGEGPEGIDLSPDESEIWTATRNDGDISIIDVATKAVIQRLDLNLQDPSRLTFTPDGDYVLIADGQGNSVVVMDAATRTEVSRLNISPNALLVQPDGLLAYAALRGDHRVAVIDLGTLEVIAEIPTGPGSGPTCMFWVQPMR